MRLKGLERFGKGLLGVTFAKLLKTNRIDQRDLEGGSVAEKRFQRVLIVKQDQRLGNLVLMTPMLSALRNRLPHAEIHLLVSDLYASLFEADSRVDRLLIMQKRRQVSNPMVLLSFLRRLRESKYDLVIEASDVNNFSLNNSLLARLARSEVRLGYAKQENKQLLNVAVSPPRSGVHAAEMYLYLLGALWQDLGKAEMWVEIPPEKVKWARSLLASWHFQPTDHRVAIHLGGRGKKRLPQEGIEELSKGMASQFGIRPIFISGPMEETYLAEMRHRTPAGSVFVRGFSILEVAALLANIDLFISADTGPMHLATACGCATLSIFTTSDPLKFAPRGDRHQYVCCLEGDLPVEEVIEKAGCLLPITERRHEVY